ncbi:hypothetical protein CC78DRAFT_578166 [Lojkania enalia]|uniref:Uncharacterized protein n=1 Tax=Lojkania enalia TaxID=147567 RepID=A0A9P4KD83_9PLEO|nr:hypothetical protein CC78DRAFT_578166 [Didymosphaeria enalia]
MPFKSLKQHIHSRLNPFHQSTSNQSPEISYATTPSVQPSHLSSPSDPYYQSPDPYNASHQPEPAQQPPPSNQPNEPPYTLPDTTPPAPTPLTDPANLESATPQIKPLTPKELHLEAILSIPEAEKQRCKNADERRKVIKEYLRMQRQGRVYRPW